MKTLEEIFANTEVDPVTGCRNWLRYIDSYGYGHVYWQGQICHVHRVIWELIYGAPGALDVLHACDNRACCEFAHLFLGTQQDNNEDCTAKGRRAYGEKNGSHKLTEAQVAEIKKLLAAGEAQRRIASAYGVYPSAITLIVQGKTWKHVSW